MDSFLAEYRCAAGLQWLQTEPWRLLFESGSVGEVVEALAEALGGKLLVDAVACGGGVSQGGSGRLGDVESALMVGRRGVDAFLCGLQGIPVPAASPGTAGLISLVL